MANITTTTQAAVLATEAWAAGWERKLADRTSIIGHPTIQAGYLGSISKQNSNVLKKRVYGVDGYDALASTAEASGPSDSALVNSTVSATVTKWSKKYAGVSDILSVIQDGPQPRQLLLDGAYNDYNVTFMAAACAVFDGFSSPVGTSGAQMTYATLLAAIAEAENRNLDGDLVFVCSNKAWSALRSNLSTITGAVSYKVETGAALAAKGPGFKCNLAGVDIYTSSRIATMNTGADHANALLGRGSLVWGDGDFDPGKLISDQTLVGKVLFEIDRNRPNGNQSYIEHMFLGVARGQNGVTVQTGV